MGNQISYAALLNFYANMNTSATKLRESIERQINLLKSFSTTNGIVGKTGESINSYLNDTFGMFQRTINSVLEVYIGRFTLYVMEYGRLDGAFDMYVNVDNTDEYRNSFGSIDANLNSNEDTVKDILDSIKEIISLSAPSYGEISNKIQDNNRIIKDFVDSVNLIEFYHLNDTQDIAETLNTLDSYMLNARKSVININSYTPGELTRRDEYAKLEACILANNKFVNENRNNIEQATKVIVEQIKAFDEEYYGLKHIFTYGIGATANHYFSADPVDLSTGNFIYEKCDLMFKGEDDFSFKRFYNAFMSLTDGPIGRGFTHNYNIRIFKSADEKECQVVLQDGHAESFYMNDKGLYENYFSNNYKLIKENGCFVCIKKNGYKYFFGTEDYIIREENRNKIGYTYEYDENNLLVRVLSDNGQYFSFSYVDDKIVSVIDNDDNKVLYEYNMGDLISVKTPNLDVYNYLYSSDGKIEEIINSTEVSIVKNTFDDNFRITRQDFSDGSFMLYEYENDKIKLTERNGAITIYEHDELNRTTKVTYPDETTELIEYNEKGQKTRFTDRNGFVSRIKYDEKCDISKVIDPLGNVTTFVVDEKKNLKSVLFNGIEKLSCFYDKDNNLVKTSDAKGNGSKFVYDNKGRIIEEVDGENNKQCYLYDNNGNIVEMTLFTGAVIKYEYDSRNNPIKIIDGNGNVSKYEYDSNDRLVKVINANGQSSEFEYTTNNKVEKIKDFDGEAFIIKYNELELEEYIIDKEGNKTSFEYDNMWNKTRIILPSGGVIKREYDQCNRMTKIVRPEGQSVKYEYDGQGNLIKETNLADESIVYKYNALGKLREVVDANNNKTTYKYDKNNELVGIIDALGNETVYKYDSVGNRISILNAENEETKFEYNRNNQLIKTIFPDKTYEEVVYKNNLVSKIRKANGSEVFMSYDANGNVISEKNSLDEETLYEYDCLNNLIKIIMPNKGCRSFEYDSAGNIVRVIDENGNTTKYEYTLNGNLSRIIDPLNNETRYKYDSLGNLVETKRIGEFDEVMSYDYNLNGDVIKITDSLGNSEVYTYDNVGRLVSKIDRDGNTSAMSYDNAGNLVGLKYSDEASVKMSFDALNRLREITENNKTTRIFYDSVGRVVSIIDENDKIDYSYYNGHKATMTYPSGKVVGYNYDIDGQMSSILVDNKELITYEYDVLGRPVKKIASNGFETNYEYSNMGRLLYIENIGNGLTEKYSYKYDLLGNKIQTVDNSGTFNYSYNKLNQLISVEKDGENISRYSYDSFGNRVSKTIKGVSTDYIYNKNNQLIKEITNENVTEYTYDKRGNNLTVMSADGLVENKYDVRNRLIQTINSEEIVKYLYNSCGNRKGEEFFVANDLISSVDYVLDLTKPYHNMLSQKNEAETLEFVYDFGPVSYIQNDDEYFYVNDDIGSVRGVADCSGKIIDKYMYDEFGVELLENKHKQPLSYTGYRKEMLTNRYFAQARQYDASVGRFVSEDTNKGSIVNPDSMNPYIYCLNNPTDFIDLDGRTAIVASLQEHVYLQSQMTQYKGAVYGGILRDSYNHVKNNIDNVKKTAIKDAVSSAIGGLPETVGGIIRDVKKMPDFKMKLTNTGIRSIVQDTPYYKHKGFHDYKFESITSGKGVKGQPIKNGEMLNKSLKTSVIAKGVGKAIAVAGAGYTFYEEFNADPTLEHHERVVDATVATGVDVAIGAGASALGGIAGAAIAGFTVGSVLPGIGNVIGLILGVLFYVFFDFLLDNFIIDGKSLKEWLKYGANYIYDRIITDNVDRCQQRFESSLIY